jgi:eukaryotic-like serine/threonine-protein kinase
LIQSKNQQLPFSFTPDGNRLALQETTGGGMTLWTLPLKSDNSALRGGEPQAVPKTGSNERHPMFSPDGRWLAYASDESGTYQIYVRAFPDRGGKWQISNSGGTYPEWSSNGRELLFRSSDSRIMVTTYTAKGDSFVADQPKPWSEKRIADFGPSGGGTYDLAPDGKHVAALIPAGKPGAQQSQNHVIFLLNFFDELRRKVPLNSR